MPTIPAGSRLLAEDLLANTSEVDNAIGAWTTWTPTLSNLTLGNGTVVARYKLIGKTLHYHFRFTLGSTSAVGTGPAFTLPFTPHSSYVAFTDNVGDGMLRDNSASQYRAGGWLTTTSGTTVQIFHSSTTTVTVTATVPFTWAVGDSLVCSGSIELA